MTASRKIIVIGGEGTATVIAEAIIDAWRNYGAGTEFIGFANDDFHNQGAINNYPIVCALKEIRQFIARHNDVKAVFSLYKPLLMRQRAKLLRDLSLRDADFVNFKHPLGYVAHSVKMGIGNVVLPCAAIHSNVKLQDFNIINSNCTIEHDAVLGSSNFLASGSTVGSAVIFGDNSFIGLNSSIREGLSIPDATFIGMGSNVIHAPVTSDQLWYGNPAKYARDNDN